MVVEFKSENVKKVVNHLNELDQKRYEAFLRRNTLEEIKLGHEWNGLLTGLTLLLGTDIPHILAKLRTEI